MKIKLEWNEVKRKQTLKERSLDFNDLVSFDWDSAMIAEDDRKDYGEARFVAFGFLKADFVGFVYTVRQDAVRIISLRKGNSRERKVYEHFKTTHQ